MIITKPEIINAKLVKIQNLDKNNFLYHFQFLNNKEVLLNIGQFFMIKLPNNGIRIPMHCMQNNQQGFTLLLSNAKENDKYLISLKYDDYLDCLMPLGRTINFNQALNNLVCVTESYLMFAYEIIKKLSKENKKINLIISFSKIENICFINEFKKMNLNKLVILCDKKTNLATKQSSIINYLKAEKIIADWSYIAVSKFQIKDIDNYLSLNGISGNILYEENMACGFGICNGCTVIKKNNLVQKCCLNPFFKIGEVNYE